MKIIQKLADKNARPFATPPVTVGFFGDSVTNGCFEVTPTATGEGYDVTYDPEHSYSAVVRKILTMLYPKAQINIINAGISGDSAVNGQKRLARDLLPYRPDLVVVCFGLNDSGRGEAGLADYRNALRTIAHALQEAGSEVIFMTPQPICARVHTQLRGEALRSMAERLAVSFADGTFEKYMSAMRETAAEANIPLCDCCQKWMTMYKGGVDITSLLANYLNHPTREMHRLFAYELVRTMFEEK